jgi:hypothetical protein
MLLAFKSGVYFWVVWGLTKIFTTYASFWQPKFLNGWYDANHRLVESLPHGDQLRALMRDNVSDGQVAFWEIWLLLGVFLSIIRLSYRARRRTVVKKK